MRSFDYLSQSELRPTFTGNESTAQIIEKMMNYIAGIRQQTDYEIRNLKKEVSELRRQTDEEIRNLKNETSELRGQIDELIGGGS